MNIIGTGLSGLVGSRIVELLPHYTFEDISRKTGTDIRNKDSVLGRLKHSDAEFVLHLAAYTNVDQAESDKDLEKNSDAWQINVGGTENVIAACEETGKKLIYISTDMVFNGDQSLESSYSEEDTPDPKNWYAMTKYEAEKRVMQCNIPWIILRIAYPYRAQFEKKEYVRVFLHLLQQQKSFSAIDDHYFTPTFIDDLAFVFTTCIKQNVTGLFHAGGTQRVSPYEAAVAIANEFGLDTSLIGKTTRELYFKDKAYRGFNLSLNNDNIGKLGIQMSSFEEGIKIIKQQITSI